MLALPAALLATVASLTATACVVDPTDPVADTTTDTGSGSGSGSGSGTDTPPAPLRASGAYQVTSTIDLTVEALLPEPAAAFVTSLRSFSTAPAHTLIALAEDAGVPAVGTLKAVLPASLESRLEGWIDAEIAKVTLGGVPVTQVAAQLAALAETTLTQVGLTSTLSVDGATTTHQLAALDFTPAGLDLQLPLAGLPGDLVRATPTTTVDDGALTVGDHGFALAYGAYAWQAVEAAFAAEYGGTIRATLGAAVNCPAIATRVAATCVWGVCVGHTAELTEVCERGLDEVVERAHAKFLAYRFDALHLAAGTATLVDTDADRTADALTEGVWTAEVNAGQGLRSVPATFTATR